MKPNILITSGPTREYLDPVRFISNASSGMMGDALARAALSRKLRVTLISGPSEVRYPKAAKIISAISAADMLRAAKKHFGSADIVIGAAAVSDYRPATFKRNKIKKNSVNLDLRLVKNADILKILGKNKKNKVLVGFALETENLISSAKKKLKSKNLDLIVANSVQSIGQERTAAYLIKAGGEVARLGDMDKLSAAKRIIDESIRIWKNNKTC